MILKETWRGLHPNLIHEPLHLVCVLIDVLTTKVSDHPAVLAHPRARALMEEALEKLSDVYCLLGQMEHEVRRAGGDV